MSIQKGSEIHRLKIVKGHLEKVIDMIVHEKDCLQTIHQLEAVIHALKKTEELLLEKYLKNYLKTHINNNQKANKLQHDLTYLFMKH